jgi:hypothetical protein
MKIDQEEEGWQAQLPPQPAAGAASAVEALLSADAVAPAAAAPVAAAEVPPEPPRKSVTYQPEPLSWKPAAVICLLNVALPQAGHSVSGASEIFCSTSLA